jgi:hypothetical protein
MAISTNDLEKLRQHHNATIGLFVAFWLFVLAAIGAIEIFDISARTRNSLTGTIFGAAIVLVLLQFTKRCPDCRANLGWQVRLGIPKNCQKCGAALRQSPDGPDTR